MCSSGSFVPGDMNEMFLFFDWIGEQVTGEERMAANITIATQKEPEVATNNTAPTTDRRPIRDTAISQTGKSWQNKCVVDARPPKQRFALIRIVSYLVNWHLVRAPSWLCYPF